MTEKNITGGGTVDKFRRTVVTIIVVIVILFIMVFVFKFFVIVGAGERAVVFNRITGVEERQLDEGFHLMIPFVQDPIIYDVKVQTYTMSGIQWEGEVRGDDSLQALTADGQNVWLDISVRFHLDPQNVWRVHKEVGRDYVAKIVRPEVRSLTRNIISKYKVTEVYSGERMNIQQEINDKLRESLAKNHIILDGTLLRNVTFSKEFQSAIEQKQIAQQEAERMNYILEKEEKEKQRKIIEAEGDAEAIRLRGKALAENPRLIDYEYVQKLSPNVQTIITDGRSILSLGDLVRRAQQ
ncbi:MAG: prohibitin family protein [bacterium]